MHKSAPIGIFDSGVGGTSIWKEIHHLLPLEHTIYLADSINAPYGEKPAEEITRLSVKNTEKLIQLGAKIIVVACNTATTNAISTLRNTYEIPFIGIEPAIKPAALQSRSGCIGILATRGTLSSALFAKTSDAYSGNIRRIEVEGKGLVQEIEKGRLDTPEMETMLRDLLRPMLAAGIDHLVLGCSHYPYLIPVLHKILPPEVRIIDSGMAVARQTMAILKNHNLLAEQPQHAPEFYTNKNPEVLRNLLPVHTKNIHYLDF